jgi:hypothetical protein
MNWLEMADVLFEKSKGLSPIGAHVHLDTAAWLRTWTAHQNLMADAAARHFAVRLDWPVLLDDIKPQLYFRCLFAIEHCFQKSSQEPKLSDCPEIWQHHLKQLLIEKWAAESEAWAERKYKLRRQALQMK